MAQVVQVAGAEVAGAAALPAPDARQGVLDRDVFTQLRAPSGAPGAAQLGQERLVGMDGHATLAAGGRPRRSGTRAGARWKRTVLAGSTG